MMSFLSLFCLQLVLKPLELGRARLSMRLAVGRHVEADDPHSLHRVEGPGGMARPQPLAAPCFEIILPAELGHAVDRRHLRIAEQDVDRHVEMGRPFLEHVERFFVIGAVVDLVAAEHNEFQFRQPSELAQRVDEQRNALLAVLPGALALDIEVQVRNVGKGELRHFNCLGKRHEELAVPQPDLPLQHLRPPYPSKICVCSSAPHLRVPDTLPPADLQWQ